MVGEPETVSDGIHATDAGFDGHVELDFHGADRPLGVADGDRAGSRDRHGAEALGAGAGALGGAALGMAIGGPAGAVIGGLVGATAGAIVGDASDGDDDIESRGGDGHTIADSDAEPEADDSVGVTTAADVAY